LSRAGSLVNALMAGKGRCVLQADELAIASRNPTHGIADRSRHRPIVAQTLIEFVASLIYIRLIPRFTA
jgi:hypothetical protein